jgi:hypothetical protein
MVNAVALRAQGGRPLDAPKSRIVLNVSPELAARLRALAKVERRPLTAQIELLIERGLRTWGEQAA